MDANTKSTSTKPVPFPKTNASQSFHEMAESGSTQAKENYDKMSAATTEAADVIKKSCSNAVKGAQEYNNKLIEFAHVNTNVAFEFFQQLFGVKSPSEFVELSTGHARKQFETMTAQTKQLAALAQQVAVAGAEPLKVSVGKAFNSN